MNNTSEKEIQLLEVQLITTILFIGSLLISIAITYNDILELKGEKEILSDDQENNLAIFNRVLVVVLTLIFLYISYENLQLCRVKKNNQGPFIMQILASELSALASIIVLYAVLKTAGSEYSFIIGGSNPNL